MKTERIERSDDPRLDAYRDIRDRPRLVYDTFLVEGREAIRTLLAHSPYRMRSLLVTPTAFGALEAQTKQHAPETEVFVVAPATLRELTGLRFQQGCLALGESPASGGVRECLAAIRRERSLVVALERVTNPDNVGSAFRNALAFGAAAIVLCDASAHPLYRKTIRTSMGAVLRIPFSHGDSWPVILSELHDEGYERVALSPRAEAVALTSWGGERRSSPRTALLVGNEGEGLSPATLAEAEHEVRIEMHPDADSVNVATATGIALHWLTTRGEL